MAILFHDDFNGTEPLDGHVPDVNMLGAGGVWASGGDIGAIAGGVLAPASRASVRYVAASMFPDAGQGVLGGPVKISFQWTPYGNASDFSNYSYPIGINFQCARVWMTANAGSASMYLGAGDQGESVGAPFVSGATYLCEITIEADRQTFSFLGTTLELTASIDTAAMDVQPIYLNQDTLSSGSPGSGLDFIKIESIAAPVFWTNLRNAREVA